MKTEVVLRLNIPIKFIRELPHISLDPEPVTLGHFLNNSDFVVS